MADESCTCGHAYRNVVIDPYGGMKAEEWVRVETHKDCPAHGWQAQARQRAEFDAGVKRLRPRIWDGRTGEALIPLSHLRAALDETADAPSAPRNGPESDERAIPRVAGPDGAGSAGSEAGLS